MQEMHLNIFENHSDKLIKVFEGKVSSLLNKILMSVLGLSNRHEKNRATNMVNCGSRGKPTNIGQITARLGQQNVDGKRIPYGFNNRTYVIIINLMIHLKQRFVENSVLLDKPKQQQMPWVEEKDH